MMNNFVSPCSQRDERVIVNYLMFLMTMNIIDTHQVVGIVDPNSLRIKMFQAEEVLARTLLQLEELNSSLGEV